MHCVGVHMAAFAETDTYLKFGEKPYGKATALLWPVLVYRVLYPEVRRPQMNLFQRVVLGLVRAKTTRTESIAELTGLHKDLVKLIFNQGISNAWLVEQADALTDKGVRVLEEEEDAAGNLRSGYIFQDAFTGKFWPRLETRLSDMLAKDPLARYPEFVDARKTGKTLRPFVLEASKSALPVLDTTALIGAYREYRNDYRSSQQLHGTSELPEQLKLQGVQSLDTSPRAARVLLWVTPDAESAQLWSIRDPFDLRDQAWWLRGTLIQMVKSDANLLQRLSALIGKPQAENQTVEEWLGSLRKQTDLRVLTEYPWVERQPDIKRYLAGLLARQEKLSQGDTGEHELEAAVIECQKLLEVVMQWLIRQFSVVEGQMPKHLRSDTQFNQKILTALQIPAFDNDVIRQLSRQKLDQVVRACSSPISSLKALLFAAALGVLSHPQHPLKTLTEQQLQLRKLLELADLRNQSGHGQSAYTGRKITQVTPQMAAQHIRYALGFTERFKEWM